MKTIFIIWILFTVLLALSVIGLILFIPKDRYGNSENTPSSWISLGNKILDKL